MKREEKWNKKAKNDRSKLHVRFGPCSRTKNTRNRKEIASEARNCVYSCKGKRRNQKNANAKTENAPIAKLDTLLIFKYTALDAIAA